MRVFFLTADDRVFLPEFYSRVFGGSSCTMAGLAVVKDPNFFRFLRKSCSFLGIRQFAGEIISQAWLRFKNVILTIATPGRKQDLKAVCNKFKVPFYTIDKVNTKNFRAFLQNEQIDVIVSVACPQILRKKILEIPAIAAINVHYGLLPNYRGQYPSFWVLANGEDRTGVSVHHMVEKVDAGDILVQIEEAIRPEDTFYSLVRRLKTTIGPQAIIEALHKIETGDRSVIKNNPEAGSYYSFPARQDMAAFRARGRRWR